MAWKKQQEEDMNLSIRVWKNKFEGYYNRWVNNCSDDRLLFCNRYEKVLESMEYMKKVNNLTIQCQMVEYYQNEAENLTETITFFTGKTQRSGELIRHPELSLNLYWEC